MQSGATSASDVDDPNGLQGDNVDGEDADGLNSGVLEGDSGGSSFCDGLFSCIPSLVLPQPASPPMRAAHLPTRGRKVTASTRSSKRLAARPSSIPLAQRAQQKLTRELDFINAQSPAPDATITAYVDMYAQDLRGSQGNQDVVSPPVRQCCIQANSWPPSMAQRLPPTQNPTIRHYSLLPP